MRTMAVLAVVIVCILPARAQSPEIKFVADTLVIQAEGSYEANPDLATITFQISSQEKVLKTAYAAASQSMQRIVALAQANNLKKEDIGTGALTVAPIYEGDRKQRARAYYVRGQVVLKVHDFTAIGPILDGSVEDGIADLRSLTYSLSDEEAAKGRAVAQAMQHAVSRATIALEQKGQKLGALRYANLDVHQLMGVVQLAQIEAAELDGRLIPHKLGARENYLPESTPEQIKVSATVQCAFQMQ